MVIPREPLSETSESGLRRDYTRAPQITKAYIVGILHDATERHTTFRISQKSSKFVQMVASGIRSLGGNAWIYKEGSSRNLYIVEFSKSFLKDFEIVSKRDKIDYIQGYFDTDGGIAKSSKVRFYIYFAQKDFSDLQQVRNYLMEMNIDCGVIHNPSKRIDPNYWRFFVKAKSYVDFVQKIGSRHPEKAKYLRLKI
jgi:hypothetical protein